VSSVPMMETPQLAADLPYSEFTERIASARFDDGAQAFAPPLSPQQAAALPEFSLRPSQAPSPRLDFGEASIVVDNAPPPASPPQERLRLKVPDTHAAFPREAILDAPPSMEALADLRPLGQLQESFIIAASRDGLWIIDQHVAHERILFEKVLRDWASGRTEAQQLLIPLMLELTASQQIEYDRIREQLLAAGFETEPFGNRTIAVKTVPAAVPLSEASRILEEILEIAEGEMRRASLEDFRRGIAASIACRAAIKINMRLEANKIDWLLRELAKTEYPMSCPHGRPVALRYGIRDILKGFHRI
jgi:DNA mismatch repair protein MutL